MMRRRAWLAGVVAGTAGSLWRGSQWALGAADPRNLDAARQQAARRRRRIIYNNDGDDIWTAGADTVEKFLEVRHEPLLGTQVDSIHYCTTQSFNRFTHATKVAEIFRAKSGNFAGNNLAGFLEQGTDGLRMSSDFARAHGMESIWTLRMNDIHDAWTPEFLSDWKRQDPARIMSTLEKTQQFSDRRRLWSLVDFEHPDVQPRMLEIIQEVLQNYEIDGVELDFLRAPIYFRSAYRGEAVTESQRAVLSDLVESIRSLVLKESQRQAKPLLLSARVPSTPASCRRIGIDIEAWLQAKWLDTIALGGGYITFDLPIQDMIALGRKYEVPVYPCLSQSGLVERPPRGSAAKQAVEAWFGAASRLWADGADGIYTFNLFPGPGSEEDRAYASRILNRIGDPRELKQGSIQYAMSDAGWWMPAHYWAKDAAEFGSALPLPLRANDFTRTYLEVPEDLRGADIQVTAELKVDFTGLTEASRPTILFGSANFGAQAESEVVAGVRRYTCRVPLQSIGQGKNRVMVKVAEEGAKLAGVELWIRRE